ncbi:hypothetical protein GCM10023178_11160 [Actinomadura luteofluorescens]
MRVRRLSLAPERSVGTGLALEQGVQPRRAGRGARPSVRVACYLTGRPVTAPRRLIFEVPSKMAKIFVGGSVTCI